jgi:PAS domain S-box-containing protein
MDFTDAVASDDAPPAAFDGRLEALEAALAEETRRADVLNRIAAAIGRGHDLQAVVQAVVDGGVELSGAQFGAFFYNLVDARGESYTLYALSGAPREAFERFAMPRNTAVFHPTFVNAGVVRSSDITKDPRYGKNPPYNGMPQGHLPVRSYLASSVVSRGGEVLGGLFFGHSEPGRFGQRMEHLMEGLAAQAAVAIDNVFLADTIREDVGAAQTTRERLRFALEAGRLGSWELDVASRAYEASDLCKANYGREPGDEFTFADLIAAIDEEDRSRMQAAMEQAIKSGAEYDIEYRVRHASGEVRWLHVRGRAAITAEKGVHRMAGVSLDVTERKRAEERQRLLLNELNHRVKNTLATVQSIASQTMRASPDPADFRPAFEARLLALSQTHNLLTNQNWEAASLTDILIGELTPHAGARDGGGARFLLDADANVRLNPKAAVALGMVVHELATNAVKYGALSKPGGRVTVRSRVKSAEGGERLTVEWIETGGPKVVQPKRRGFGTRLLQQGLAGELGGEVDIEYRPDGLWCRIKLPMHALEPLE